MCRQVSLIIWCNGIRRLVSVLTFNKHQLSPWHDKQHIRVRATAMFVTGQFQKQNVRACHNLCISQRTGNETANLHFDRSLYITSGLRDTTEWTYNMRSLRLYIPTGLGVRLFEMQYATAAVPKLLPFTGNPHITLFSAEHIQNLISYADTRTKNNICSRKRLRISATCSIQLFVLSRQPKCQ
jgi:hypothetical protein